MAAPHDIFTATELDCVDQCMYLIWDSVDFICSAVSCGTQKLALIFNCFDAGHQGKFWKVAGYGNSLAMGQVLDTRWLLTPLSDLSNDRLLSAFIHNK